MLSQYLAVNACSVKQMIRQLHGSAHVATASEGLAFLKGNVKSISYSMCALFLN